MSGHSKWHNIRVRKGAQDAKRGKVYTKYARLVEIAAREGGGDPVSNIRLRALIDAAKAESVPNANIERAIKKGTGALKGEAMQEVLYEGYGPGGAAFLIECLTENKNRTLSNVKLLLSKHGGRFAESGSVQWMFERRGVVRGEKSVGGGQWSDDFELALIDAGADAIEQDQDHVHIISDISAWTKIRDLLAGKGWEIHFAGLQYIPKQTAPVDAITLEKVHAIADALEADDDVSEVHMNATLA